MVLLGMISNVKISVYQLYGMWPGLRLMAIAQSNYTTVIK